MVEGELLSSIGRPTLPLGSGIGAIAGTRRPMPDMCGAALSGQSRTTGLSFGGMLLKVGSGSDPS